MLGNHLLGLYEKALDPSDIWETRLRKAKQLGFDYMEMSIDETDERISRLYWSPDQIEVLRQTCYNVGIQFQSMCLSAHRRFPFGSADPMIREKAYDIMQRAIDFSVAMGIRVIQLAGYDVYYEESTPESVKRFEEGLAWAVKAAAQKQVMLAMEIMDTRFLNSITKNNSYEKKLHSPWYRVYPDVGNLSAWPENDVDAEIESGIGSIVAIHLKDTIAVTDSYEGKFKCVPFGAGCVDFPARFAQLESLGYTGPYMIEMWSNEDGSDMESVTSAKQWLTEQYKIGTGK